MSEAGNTVSGTLNLGVIIQGQHVVVNLPAQLTPAMSGLPATESEFTGRADALGAVLDVLAPRSSVRVTAVGGMGGIGKTALAVRAARTALERGWFAGGVLFVDMFGYDPERAVNADAAVEGFLRAMAVPDEHIPPGAGEQQRLYRSVLEGYASAGRPVLVVLDNVSDATQVLPLLPAHHACRAIVTSRDRLARLDARLVGLGALPIEDSVELLRAALRTRLPEDQRLASGAEDTTNLAELCAGLPLALRIAAALLAENVFLTPAKLTDLLRPAGDRLGEFDDGTDALTAVFDLSYHRLVDDLKRVFALLAASPGPDISTAAAAALTGLDHTSARRALTKLARSHLIEPSPAPAGHDGRWRLHDLMRLYSQHLPADRPGVAEREPAMMRLLDHYETVSRQAEARYSSSVVADLFFRGFPDLPSAQLWLDAELDNVAAAINAAPTTERHRAFIRDVPFLLAAHLNRRRRFRLWTTLTTLALRQAEHLGDRQRQGQAWNNLGAALEGERRFQEAADASARALEIFRDLGDRNAEATALTTLGDALQELYRYDEAIAAHRAAADIHRENCDPYGEGTALNNLSNALRETRRFLEAADASTRAAKTFRDVGDRNAEATALDNLGNALQELYRYDEAIAAHRAAADIHRENCDPYGEGTALNNLGCALVSADRFNEAIEVQRQNLAICRELEDRHGEGQALNNLGNALRENGQFDEAVLACTEAATIFAEVLDRRGEGQALHNLGLALGELDRTEESASALTRAVAAHHETGDRHSEAQSSDILGSALQDMHRFHDAVPAHRNAATAHRETGDLGGEGIALYNLGIALMNLDDREALEVFDQAATAFHRSNDRQNEGRALTNLGVLLSEAHQWERAIDVHSRAVAAFRDAHDAHGESIALNNLRSAQQSHKPNRRWPW